MATRLSEAEQAEVRRLVAAGVPVRRIALMMHKSFWGVNVVLRPSEVMKEEGWQPGRGRLTMQDREEIRVGLEAGETFTAIADRLGYAVSTISREVANNGGRSRYRAVSAHRRAARCARRPKPFKLGTDPQLRLQVEEWLLECWSPEQIAARLRDEFPDDPMMRVSHETIYHTLFVQGRGGLRKELVKCLRTGRAQRRSRSRIVQRPGIANMVSISERPAEVADRAVPGHWEGDLLIGSNSSAVGTLVERTSRYVLLLHLPHGRGAEQVTAAMIEAIRKLPEKLALSITWDRGRELARHREFTIATGIRVYFCDPSSPWQRGTNENTNGLLRQFLPKGTDLNVYTRADLDEIERKLNGRPRKTLDWRKPYEKLDELIALTA